MNIHFPLAHNSEIKGAPLLLPSHTPLRSLPGSHSSAHGARCFSRRRRKSPFQAESNGADRDGMRVRKVILKLLPSPLHPSRETLLFFVLTTVCPSCEPSSTPVRVHPGSAAFSAGSSCRGDVEERDMWRRLVLER